MSAAPPPPSRRERMRRSRRQEPLWDRIDRNRVKTAVFLVSFVLGLGVATALLVGTAGAFVGVVLIPHNGTVSFFQKLPWIVLLALVAGAAGAIWHIVRSLDDPHRRLPRLFGARIPQNGTLRATKSALHDMAIAAGLEHSPQLWVIDDDRVNAFVVGLRREDAVVGVTRGLTERITPDEQRAVFANLMARLCSGDVIWSTAVSAVMGPIWHARAQQLRAQSDEDSLTEVAHDAPSGGAWIIIAALAVVVTELMMAGHERAALMASEKADSEGMLLLKDPRSMLGALNHVLDANNTVATAGEEYSMLFYCWAGFGYAPEDDPEMDRIERLREVLGAEGST